MSRRQAADGRTGRAFLRRGAWCVMLAAATYAYGCMKMQTSRAREGLPSELRVGTAPNYPPLAFKENGQLRGVELELAQRLAQELNTKVSVIETRWEDLIPALEKGEIDVIMSGMSITEDRSKRVRFTVPYLNIGQMALIRKADYERLRERSAMDQPTSRIGFVAGTTGEGFAREQLQRATLVPLLSTDDGIAALRSNRIDFFIQDAPAIWRITGNLQAQYPDLMGRYRLLTAEYLAWAVRKNDDALLEKLNAVLLRWEQNGKLDTTLDHWIPVRKIAIDIEPAP